ncbi:MAG TPA: xanthine dehydrogenase family protein subunit M [Desulfuromonadales bacterium]|nr:xanthine dehydrogenase family protein subunit M [Desulfuromonadales bacterium]
MLPNFSYVKAASLKEAIRQLGTDQARVHAGGTDLLGCLHDHVFTAGKLVSISGLEELRGIGPGAGGGLRIGALTTVTQVAEHSEIRRHYPLLAQSAQEVASPQLRRQGTLGGNLCQKPRCWYYRGEFDCLRKGGPTCFAFAGENQYHCILGGKDCYIVHPSDIAPALVALDARVRIAGPGGPREVAVEDFHVPPAVDPQRETALGPQEILTEILLPPPRPGLRSAFRKVRARRSWDFAVAGVALALQVDGDRVGQARVVLSGAAPVPWRAREAEAALTGRKLDAEAAKRAAEAALQGAAPLQHNGYKVALFEGLIEEELRKIAG